MLCVTSTLALLIQFTFTDDTPTIRLGSSTEAPRPDEETLAESNRPNDEAYLYGRNYGAFLGDPSKSTQQEQHQAPQSNQSKLDSQPDTSRDRLHGTFPDGINDFIPPEKYPNAPEKTTGKKDLAIILNMLRPISNKWS